MTKYKPFMPLKSILKYEKEMKDRGVSEVARSRRGFLTAYKKAKGNPDNLSEKWKDKRKGFIARHDVQYQKNPTRRRKLALYAWAYRPRLKK